MWSRGELERYKDVRGHCGLQMLKLFRQVFRGQKSGRVNGVKHGPS